ncbi:ribonuclease H1-like [Haliotis rubra]|uniref:ribonuclease H1-like n=1 Tax=Haliotis rubra TaxID=36100 RepID=UPI001EE502DF|nr:ribonuclease H1-like [Haliotis rubra]
MSSWTRSFVVGIKIATESYHFFRYNMFYAVRVGRNPGIYKSWLACKAQVSEFPSARYKKFATEDLALEFVDSGESAFSNHFCSIPSMADSKATAALNSVRKTANKIQGQLELMSSTYSTLCEQIDTLEEAAAGSSLKRSSSEGSSDKGSKKLKTEDSSDASGWSGTPFTDPSAPSVYTDGACFNNGKKGAVAGIGVFWGPGHKNNCSERLGGRPTNNRAEIHAAAKAVRQAKSKGLKNLVINTDSEFLINCITKWVKGWKKKGWKTAAGTEVANKEDIQELDEVLQGINVKWMHVRGHQGIPGNEAADKLANEGARKPSVD